VAQVIDTKSIEGDSGNKSAPKMEPMVPSTQENNPPNLQAAVKDSKPSELTLQKLTTNDRKQKVVKEPKAPTVIAEILSLVTLDDSKRESEFKHHRNNIITQVKSQKIPSEDLLTVRHAAIKAWGVSEVDDLWASNGSSNRTVPSLATTIDHIAKLWRECLVGTTHQRAFWERLSAATDKKKAEETAKKEMVSLRALSNQWQTIFSLVSQREKLRDKLKRAAAASTDFSLFYKQTFHDWKTLKGLCDDYAAIESGSPEVREVEVWGVPVHFLVEIDLFEVGYVQNLKIRADVRERVRKLAS
jgi:hypothetical protein